MGNNRNPSDESPEPGSAELDEQSRRAQEQDSLSGGRRSEDEGTTTQPWIRNKT